MGQRVRTLIASFRRCRVPACASLPGVTRDRTLATAPRFDQPHRLAADENPSVVLVAPAERRHITILAQRSAAVSLLEARTQRCPDVRIGSAVQQQTGEARVVWPSLPVVHPDGGL